MDEGAWRATVHGVAKSQTRLSDFTFTEVEFVSLPLESEVACDFLWAIECGTSDLMPIPSLVLKGSDILQFFVSEP